MLKKIPHSKSEARRIAIQMKAFQKVQEKLQDKPQSAPIGAPDPKLPVAIIVDVDGTLAFRSSRGVYDFKKSINDTVALPIKYLLQLIDDQNKWMNKTIGKMNIIIMTGREDTYRDVTNDWLNKHQIPFHHLYMRRAGDRRPAPIVKEEIFAANIKGKYNVFFVLEDDPRNIEMFRSHGLYCWVADNSRD